MDANSIDAAVYELRQNRIFETSRYSLWIAGGNLKLSLFAKLIRRICKLHKILNKSIWPSSWVFEVLDDIIS